MIQRMSIRSIIHDSEAVENGQERFKSSDPTTISQISSRSSPLPSEIKDLIMSPAPPHVTKKRRAYAEPLDPESPETELVPLKKCATQEKSEDICVTVGPDDTGALDGNLSTGSMSQAPRKRRRPPTITHNQKGNWSKSEDDLIISLKAKKRTWLEITTKVTETFGTERTLTAVRLRFQKVLKDRDLDISAEEMKFLQQAVIDVEGPEKYRFVALRFKELTKKELSKVACKNLVVSLAKGQGQGAK